MNAADKKQEHPLQKLEASISLLYRQGEAAPAKYDPVLHGHTDARGEAQFTLPGPPPAHLSASVRMEGRWHCGCSTLAVTQDVIKNGLVRSYGLENPSAPVTAKPAEIVFVARPLSILERLLAPLLKE